jgi:hypothetical protein
MNRHSFRWEALAFGLLFLAVVGTWTAWKTGVLESDQLAYAPAGTLIVLGVAGIIASFASPRKTVDPASTPAAEAEQTVTEEVPDDAEETDPQS